MNRTDKYISRVANTVSRVALFDAALMVACLVMLLTGVDSDVVAISAIASTTIGLLWGCSSLEKIDWREER